MSGNSSGYVVALKLLVVLLLPLLLPTPASGAAQVILLAAAGFLVAVFAMTAGRGMIAATTGPPIGRRDAAPPPHCGLSDPDAPGHVRARAPGVALRSV